MRPPEFTQNRRKSGICGSEIAASMAAVLGMQLRKHGIAESNADEIAVSVLDEVRIQYGGQNVYFPREQKERISDRDDEIYDRFSRNEISIPNIAQEYGISLQWAYHIIRAVRAKRKAEREAERAAEKLAEHKRWKAEN